MTEFTEEQKRIRKWLQTKDEEQLISFLLYEYALEELSVERAGDILAGEYKEGGD